MSDDLRDLVPHLVQALPPGCHVTVSIPRPPPEVVDGICQDCGMPEKRPDKCPRGKECRTVKSGVSFAFCSGCTPCDCLDLADDDDWDDEDDWEDDDDE